MSDFAYKCVFVRELISIYVITITEMLVRPMWFCIYTILVMMICKLFFCEQAIRTKEKLSARTVRWFPFILSAGHDWTPYTQCYSLFFPFSTLPHAVEFIFLGTNWVQSRWVLDENNNNITSSYRCDLSTITIASAFITIPQMGIGHMH